MSGRKNNLLKFQVITNGAGVGDLTSAVTNIQWLDNIGYQINMTGSLTGLFAVQCSLDYLQDNNGNVTNAGNWISVTLTTPPAVVSGNPTNIYIDINQISAPWLRLIYTHTSGTGTVNAFITAKEL